MDSNLYALERVVQARLSEARARAHRRSLAALARRRRRPFRAVLGLRLIAWGRWLAASPALAPARTS
jgi:hypothetical protein